MDAVLANALLDPDRLKLDLSDPRPDKGDAVQPSAP